MFLSDLLFLAKLADPDTAIFFAFGALLALILLLSSAPRIKLVIAVLALLEAAFIWKIALGLAAPGLHLVPERFERLALLFVWHHWLLLLPVPILLAAAMIILAVYRGRIVEPHSAVYRQAAVFSVLTAFVLFSLSVIENIF